MTSFNLLLAHSYSFRQSIFTQYLLSGYYVLGIVLEVGNMTEKNKISQMSYTSLYSTRYVQRRRK